MSDSARYYDFHGSALCVRSELPALLERFNAIAWDRLTGHVADAFVLELGYGAVSEEETAPTGFGSLRRSELAHGVPVFTGHSDNAWYLTVPGRTCLIVNWSERTAAITVAPGAENYLGLGALLPAVCHILARDGHYVLHAAGLSATEGTPRALLLLGESGRGKTTTALALAQGGLGLMADDAMFLTRRTAPDGSLALWGLPRPCKVHRETVALLPEIEPLCRTAPMLGEEYLIELRSLRRDAPCSPAPPRLLLFLEPRNTIEHRLAPLDRVAALSRLARENVRAIDQRAEGPAGFAFRSMTEMVAQCEVYTLSVGPRLDQLSALILDRLQEV